MQIVVVLICLVAVSVLAIYHTVFKIRQELNESLGKLNSEFAEVRKLLEKMTQKP